MTTIKHQIKHLNGCVLFEADIPADTPSGLAMRAALEKAVSAGAYLTGANLDGANLDGAYLTGAYLAGANLAGAYLDGANLDGANLAGANLDGAYLDGAYLTGANLARSYLDGANLDGANLVGNRPILQIGPIGSRCAYLVSYITDAGIKVRAGCFFGSIEEFEAACARTHGDNDHGKEYAAAVAMIRAHAAIWTPRVAA